MGVRDPYRLDPAAPASVVAAIIEASVLEYHLAAAMRVPGAKWHVDDAVAWITTGTPVVDMNGVFASNWDERTVENGIRRTLEELRTTGLPYLWHVGSACRPAGLVGKLRSQGLTHHETEPEMALGLEEPGARRVDRGDLAFVAVRTRDAMRVWVDTWASGAPAETRELALLVFGAPPLDEASPFQYRIAYLKGRPVATSLLYLGDRVAALHWVATIPAERRRGVGAAVTARAIGEAKQAGYLTLVLTASPDGEAIYRRLGFRTYLDIVRMAPNG